MFETEFFIYLAIFGFAFFAQTVVGFGGNILALTLGALLFDVRDLLTWQVPMVIALSTYIIIRHHEHIAWKLLLTGIAPGMLLGMVGGQYLFYSLDGSVMVVALGVLVIILALRELMRAQPRTQPRAMLHPWMLAAGVIHGLYATGGPLLVYGLSGQPLDKGAFRSTLSLVWLSFGVMLVSSYYLGGLYTAESLPRIGALALVLPISIIIGEKVHKRIPAETFRRAVQVLLLCAGVALLLK